MWDLIIQHSAKTLFFVSNKQHNLHVIYNTTLPGTIKQNHALCYSFKTEYHAQTITPKIKMATISEVKVVSGEIYGKGAPYS